jgi:hypothetical protein
MPIIYTQRVKRFNYAALGFSMLTLCLPTVHIVWDQGSGPLFGELIGLYLCGAIAAIVSRAVWWIAEKLAA